MSCASAVFLFIKDVTAKWVTSQTLHVLDKTSYPNLAKEPPVCLQVARAVMGHLAPSSTGRKALVLESCPIREGRKTREGLSPAPHPPQLTPFAFPNLTSTGGDVGKNTVALS